MRKVLLVAALVAIVGVLVSEFTGKPPYETVVSDDPALVPATSPAPSPKPSPEETAVSMLGKTRPEPTPMRWATRKDIDEITRRNTGNTEPLPVFREMFARASEEAPTVLRTSNGFVVSFRSQVPTAAVHAGVLVTGGGRWSQVMFGLDARDGSRRWSLDLPDSGPSAPACDAGLCAFNTESCSLYVIDVATGAPVWGKWLSRELLNAPAIAGGRVFSAYPTFTSRGVSRAMVAAFDARSGDVLWNRLLDEDVVSAPRVEGDDLVVATLSGSSFRFRQSDGAPISAKPRVAVIGTGVGDGASWRWMESSGFSRTLASGDLSITRDRGHVAAGRNGTLVWSQDVGATTPPIEAGGSIWVGTHRGTIVSLDRETGEVGRRFEIGSRIEGEPVIENGWIYASTRNGLIALDTKDPSLTGWSQWGGGARETAGKTALFPSP